MLEISLDWIEITLKTNNPSDAMEWMRLKKCDFLLSNGKYGYKQAYKHEEYMIIFLFDGNDNMNVHMSVAGHSIEFLKDCLKVDSFGLIKYLSGIGSFTRIDIACDDVGMKFFKIKEIKKLLLKGSYVGAFKSFVFIDSFAEFGRKLSGQTIYCGKRISDVMLRIYNKTLEKAAKLPDPDPNDPQTVRWELEIKHKTADKAARLMIDYGDIFIAYQDILTGFIRFIKNDNERKTRCTVLEKWLDFTNAMPGARIVGSRKILTIDEKKAWLWNSCSKSVALVNEDDPDFMGRLISHGNDLLEK